MSNLFTGTKDRHFYPNLLTNQRVALQELCDDDSIVITPVDKGGAVVIQDTDSYRAENLRQLGDQEFYSPLMTDPTSRFLSMIKRTLNNAKAENYITKDEFNFLLQAHPVRPVFYTLPKIHKKCEDSVPGRPIVAGCHSVTEPISQYVDWHIKPMVRTLPSYLQDTTDFLNKLTTVHVSETDSLCTMDVTSLYMNMKHDLGLSALDYYLNSRETNQPPKTSCGIWHT